MLYFYDRKRGYIAMIKHEHELKYL